MELKRQFESYCSDQGWLELDVLLLSEEQVDKEAGPCQHFDISRLGYHTVVLEECGGCWLIDIKAKVGKDHVLGLEYGLAIVFTVPFGQVQDLGWFDLLELASDQQCC